MEGGQRGNVHANREEQAGIEHPAEELVVELEVHEVTHHDEELHHHHDQKRRKEERSEVHVIGGNFQRRDCGQDQRDVDVATGGHSVLGGVVGTVSGGGVVSGVGGHCIRPESDRRG